MDSWALEHETAYVEAVVHVISDSEGAELRNDYRIELLLAIERKSVESLAASRAAAKHQSFTALCGAGGLG